MNPMTAVNAFNQGRNNFRQEQAYKVEQERGEKLNAFNQMRYGGQLQEQSAWRTPGINPNAPQSQPDARQFAIDNQLWEQVQQMDAETQAKTQEAYGAVGRIAQAALQLPPEERPQFAEYALQQAGLPPEMAGQVPSWDNASLEAISRQHLDVEEQLNQLLGARKQSEVERSARVGERNTAFANQTQRMNVQQNADPALVREFKFAQSQGFQGGYDDFLAAKKSPGVTVNAGGPEPSEAAFRKAIGGIHAKRLGSMLDGADVSRNMVDKLNIMEGLLSDGLETGRLQRAIVPMQQLASDFGIKTEGLSEKETFRALSNQLALTLRNPESGMGLTGNTSNRDVIFLKESVPGLEKSEEGNRLILTAFKKFEQRKIQIADLAEQYAMEKGTLAGFQQYLEQWSEQNPLFTEEERQRIRDVAQKGGATNSPDGIVWDE